LPLDQHCSMTLPFPVSHVDFRTHNGLSYGSDVRQFDLFVSERGRLVPSRLVGDEPAFTLESRLGSAPHLEASIRVLHRREGTDDFARMDPYRRDCYYPKEMMLKYFDDYAQSHCVLECAWESAVSRCGCVPWYVHLEYPRGEGVDICEMYGNECFSRIVDNRYKLGKKVQLQIHFPFSRFQRAQFVRLLFSMLARLQQRGVRSQVKAQYLKRLLQVALFRWSAGEYGDQMEDEQIVDYMNRKNATLSEPVARVLADLHKE